MENGTFAPHNIFINLTFQRHLKALVWSKGLIVQWSNLLKIAIKFESTFEILVHITIPTYEQQRLRPVCTSRGQKYFNIVLVLQDEFKIFTRHANLGPSINGLNTDGRKYKVMLSRLYFSVISKYYSQ